MMGKEGRRHKQLWCGKRDESGGVVVMVKELCEKMVEVRRVNDRMMAVVLVNEEGALRLICGHALPSGRCLEQKQSSLDELKGKWDLHSADDLVMRLGDLNGHIGRHIDGFDGVHGEYGISHRKFKGRMLLEFCLEKELCMSNIWSKREEISKVTFRMGENETDFDFALIKKGTSVAYMKCEGNPWGVSTCLSGRHRQEENR